MPDDAGDSREQGIDLGELWADLQAHDYPATTDELLASFGDRHIELVDGTRRVAEVLDGGDEEFASADDVRESIYTMVGGAAVGRRKYTDRATSTHGMMERDSF